MDGKRTVYAFGLIKSLEIEVLAKENPAGICNPTLEFHTSVINLIECRTIDLNGVQPPEYSTTRSFNIPSHAFRSIYQCEEWVRSKLKSLRVMVVSSEYGNVKERLVGLVWDMRTRVEANEICIGIVKMIVLRVMERTTDFRRQVVEKWTKITEQHKFMGEENQSCTCAICLEEIEVSSAAVKLHCCHDFHSKCIADWLIRKTNCPCCRRKVCIRFKFEMLKIANTQFQLAPYILAS